MVVDSSLVKEEFDESEQLSKSAISYGVMVSDSSATPDAQDGSNQVVQHRYETHSLTTSSHQSQPLAEAVAEALAGPSGMQTASFLIIYMCTEN